MLLAHFLFGDSLPRLSRFHTLPCEQSRLLEACWDTSRNREKRMPCWLSWWLVSWSLFLAGVTTTEDTDGLATISSWVRDTGLTHNTASSTSFLFTSVRLSLQVPQGRPGVTQVGAAHTVVLHHRGETLSLGSPHFYNEQQANLLDFALERDAIFVFLVLSKPALCSTDVISVFQGYLLYTHPWKDSLEEKLQFVSHAETRDPWSPAS